MGLSTRTLKSIGKQASHMSKREAVQATRAFKKEALSVAKKARQSARDAIVSFVADGDAYISQNGKYYRMIGGNGKPTSISEALFNRAKDVADAAKPAGKLKESAEGALGGIRGKMDSLGTRASERLGVNKNIGNAIAGGTVGGAGGAIVGGTVAAIDGNDNTTVMGGALGGAFIGGAAGGLYGGLMGFTPRDLDIAEDIAKAGVDGPPPAPTDVAEEIAKTGIDVPPPAHTKVAEEIAAEPKIYKEGAGGQMYFGDTEDIIKETAKNAVDQPKVYQEGNGQLNLFPQEQIEGQMTIDDYMKSMEPSVKQEPSGIQLSERMQTKQNANNVLGYSTNPEDLIDGQMNFLDAFGYGVITSDYRTPTGVVK